ncbi:YjcZ family sporulation protein [Peribacillus butanolivorans]
MSDCGTGCHDGGFGFGGGFAFIVVLFILLIIVGASFVGGCGGGYGGFC